MCYTETQNKVTNVAGSAMINVNCCCFVWYFRHIASLNEQTDLFKSNEAKLHKKHASDLLYIEIQNEHYYINILHEGFDCQTSWVSSIYNTGTCVSGISWFYFCSLSF